MRLISLKTHHQTFSFLARLKSSAGLPQTLTEPNLICDKIKGWILTEKIVLSKNTKVQLMSGLIAAG